MKRNTPLDYAEFLLTHSRTRCELHIYANGVKEKLASGYLKPFVAHLRAVEAQVAKGNQVIRLERPSNFLKKNKVTWFTKGTLERFVRFVSTPEVLERVKNIDEELSQLEHVRVALSKTSSQTEDSFYLMDTTNPGVFETKGNAPVKDKKMSTGMGDSAADGSKIELLRAMDVRLIALKQDQSEAFSRAMAAGFDSSNMADLLDFSEHFGAERLREACIQFAGLCRRRKIPQEIAEVIEPLAPDAASSDSDMSLESCTDVELPEETGKHCYAGVEGDLNAVKITDIVGEPKLELKDERNSFGSNPARTRSRWGPPERLQINHGDPEVRNFQVSRTKVEVKHELRNYSHQDDIGDSHSDFQASGDFKTTIHLEEQSKRSSTTDCPASFVSSSGGDRLQGKQRSEGNIRGGMFFSRLQKMAQQVEARRSSEDLGVQFTSVERSADSSGSQLSAGYGYSSSLYNSAVNLSGNSPLSMVSDAVSARPHRQENNLVSLPSVSTSPFMEETSKVGNTSISNSSIDHVATEDGDKKSNINLEKSGKLQTATSESSKVEEKQEEPVSSSARRLSVQAAISLFENKKATVGEPPTRKLARQDSQKAAVQSGSSAVEKSVLRRWSGLGNDSINGKQGMATEAVEKGQEKVVDAPQKDQVFVENESLRSNKLLHSATDTSSCQSALPAVPVDSSSLKQIPSTQVVDAPQKAQIFAEEESLRTNKLPHSATDRSLGQLALRAALVDSSSLQQMPSAQQQSFLGIASKAPGEVLLRKSEQESEKNSISSHSNLWMNAILPSKPVADTLKPADLTIRTSAIVAEPVNKDIRRAPVRKEVVDVQGQSNQDFEEPKVKFLPGSLGIGKSAAKRLPNYEDLKVDGPVEKLKVDSLEHKTRESRPAESKLPFKIFSKPDKEPSLNLHETPVDLYMQALVMIIDNHHQSSLGSGDEESLKEQRGRLYEQYRQLRYVRQKGENPVKRAEREAKLKSMQEILERRKDEMEARVSRQTKNSRFGKEQEGIAQQVKTSGHTRILQEEKEMGEDEVVGQQDGLVFASSHAQQMSKTKVQAARKATPKLQKSASASRRVAAPSSSSPRTMPNIQSGTGASVNNQHKEATTSFNRSVDSPVYRNLPMKSNADFSCQPSNTKKDQSVPSEARASYGQLQRSTAVESFQGYVDPYPYTSMDDKLSSAAKLFLRQNHDKFAPGSGLAKHEVFGHRHSSAGCNEQSCSSFDGCESGTKTVSRGREGAQDVDDVEKSLESSILSHAVKYSSMVHPEKSRSNDDKSVSLTQNSLKSLNGKSSDGHVLGDASNDERILYADHMEQKMNIQRDQVPSQLNEYGETSSICSPSLRQELEEHGTAQGTYSPKPSISPYSPLGSPVSWTYSKAKHPLEHEKHSPAPQSSKEPTRGFKRLLHFGRKSRTSEAVSSDGVSVSTASEGDDETEEVREPMRQSPKELYPRAKLHERGRNVNSIKDSSGFQDQGPTHVLGSSIPLPSSNFKLREDHFRRGSSLKASRSFFSLSSFRSRSGEGKSR